MIGLNRQLQTQVKHLNCMNSITALSEKKEPIHTVCQKVLNLIPPSLETPQHAHALFSLTGSGETVRTEGFKQGKHVVKEDVYVFDEPIGTLEVHMPFPETDNDSSFEFEQSDIALIKTVALRMGRIIELINSRLELENYKTILEQKVENRTNQLEAAKNNAEQANRMKDFFIQSISHDLRNPLHGIIGFAKFGIDRINKVERDKLLNYFQGIYDSSNKLLELLNNMLDISKLEEGKLEIQLARQDARDIIEYSVPAFGAILEEKKQDLIVNLPETQMIVMCDINKIIRVVTNLLSNAIAHTPIGKQIHISLEENKPTPSHYTISVFNQGPTLPDDELETIFDKFYQSANSRSSGSGLGLTICKKFVEAHLGEIYAENVSREGVNVYFSLPYNLPGESKRVRLLSEAN